eukprot:m.204206 g.204206  ORF g.204206 m.204206 type:complete len:195 (-) comp16882_c4_seq3:129-713(-)
MVTGALRCCFRIMYLPGRRTYDPAGQTADLDKATIRIGTHTARLLTHISAILISCCLHGACEDAIQQQLQSQLADVMEQTDSRQWLFRWMYEQILCTFIRRQQAMSYGAFLQAAADNHEFDLTAEGHQHSKTYLESRGNGPNDGQPPAEYFIQQAYAVRAHNNKLQRNPRRRKEQERKEIRITQKKERTQGGKK